MDNRLLRELACRQQPVKVAISGMGRFTAGLLCQAAYIPGMQIVAVHDREIRYGEQVLAQAGLKMDDYVRSEQLVEAQNAIERGKILLSEDTQLLLQLDIDVLVEASGWPEEAASLAYQALEAGIHVVMVTIEADVAVGPVLRRTAERNGVVYTLADGDQPSIAQGLYNWACTIGLQVTVIGKWSGVYSEAEAERRIQEDRALMRVSDIAYLDGSKNQMEMACIANMSGFAPDVDGLHMPRCQMAELPNLFRLQEDGGLLRREQVVEVVNCRRPDGTLGDTHLRGGVFIIFTSPHSSVIPMIGGKGLVTSKDCRYSMIYRQHHLIGVETPYSILKAAVLHEASASPRHELSADVIAVAKRDLQAGEQLDGQGGKCVRGVMVSGSHSLTSGYLPLALAQGVRLNRAVAKGERITYNMLEQLGESMIWQLRRQL